MNKRDVRSAHFRHRAAVTGSVLVIAVAAGVSFPAHAKYRCDSPRTLDRAEQHACELAKRGAASELRQFIQRTAPIYGLYFYDFIAPADFDQKSAMRSNGKRLSVADARTRQIK